MLKSIKVLFLLCIIQFLICPAVFAEYQDMEITDIKITRSKPTDILIYSFRQTPIWHREILASEMPFLTSAKTFFVRINTGFNYTVESFINTEQRNESYKNNFLASAGAYFIFEKFSVGVSIEVGPIKRKSERTLLHYNTTGTNWDYFDVTEKSTVFHLNLWFGYRLSDNVGIGFDIHYKTDHREIDVDEYNPEVTPYVHEDHFYYNSAEDILHIGPSFTHKISSFLRYNLSINCVIKILRENFHNKIANLISFSSFLKITFIPITDKLYINLDLVAELPINGNPEFVGNENTGELYYKALKLKAAIITDYWILHKEFYLRLGPFYEYKKLSRDTKRYLLASQDRYYSHMWGIQFGAGWDVSKTVKLTFDFIFKRHQYLDTVYIDGIASYNEPYNAFEMIFATYIKM